MEIENCLWLNISSDRHTSLLSRGQPLRFTGIFTALFLFIPLFAFPLQKNVCNALFSKPEADFPIASGCSHEGNGPGCSGTCPVPFIRGREMAFPQHQGAPSPAGDWNLILSHSRAAPCLTSNKTFPAFHAPKRAP